MTWNRFYHFSVTIWHWHFPPTHSYLIKEQVSFNPLLGARLEYLHHIQISFNILVKTMQILSQEEVSKIPKEWMNEAITCIKYEFHRCSHCKITHKTQICAEARQPGRYQHCPSFASPAWWLPVGWSGSGLVWTLHHSAVVHRLHLVRLCPYQRSHLPLHTLTRILSNLIRQMLMHLSGKIFKMWS